MKRLNTFSLKTWVRSSIFIFATLFIVSDSIAQSFWFGPYFGPGLGTQRWNSYERLPAFTYHFGAFIESYDEDNEMNSLFASLGYHQRGSSLRTRYNIIGTNNFLTQNNTFLFNNIVLVLGAKRQFNTDRLSNFYYSFGIRAEYNLSTNLDKYQNFGTLYFPTNDFVRKLTGGIKFAGGYDFRFSELFGGYVQLSIDPDFFNQYNKNFANEAINPLFPTNTITIPPQEIKNISIELTLGIKFLRKVVYY